MHRLTPSRYYTQDRLDAMMERTVNLDVLRSLPIYQGSLRISDQFGNGCAGDAPGFPSYFTRSLYTGAGDTPLRGSIEVIEYRGVRYVTRSVSSNTGTWEADYHGYRALLHRLWIAPAYESPRVQAWVDDTMRHFKNCYIHPTETEHGRAKMVIFPVPFYELSRFHDDPRFNDEWRTTARAEVEAYNANLIAERAKIAVPDNHLAVRTVRDFYPDAPLESLLPRIATPPDHLATWFKYLDAQPPVGACPGEPFMAHPSTAGKFCQFCGRTQE